ncbi:MULTISPECIES: hypothetical protein [Pseudomonadota]|uniref:hypothetical protein n=1 Tax=Pseudomonadota TaxID=1224 RepID=UPI003274A067
MALAAKGEKGYGANHYPKRMPTESTLVESEPHLAAVDRDGVVIQRSKFGCDTFHSFFDMAPGSLIGLTHNADVTIRRLATIPGLELALAEHSIGEGRPFLGSADTEMNMRGV